MRSSQQRHVDLAVVLERLADGLEALNECLSEAIEDLQQLERNMKSGPEKVQ